MSLKGKLKELRTAKGLSVAELAEQSGVSPPYIWQIEGGKRKNPSGEILHKLASTLGTTVGDLIGTSLDIPEASLAQIPASLRRLAKNKATELDMRQEDVDMLKNIHYRGKRPSREEDWELIFLFLKRILG